MWEDFETLDKLTVRASLGNYDSHFSAPRSDHMMNISPSALWAYPELNDTEQIIEMTNRYRFNEDDLLNVNQVKYLLNSSNIMKSRIT